MKFERPQVITTREPSAAMTTGCAGSERAMSASRRPDTKTDPSVSTSASMLARVETS